MLELRRRVRHPAVRGDPTDPGPHDRTGRRERDNVTASFERRASYQRRGDHAATRDRRAAPHGGPGDAAAPHGGPSHGGAVHRGPGHHHGPGR